MNIGILFTDISYDYEKSFENCKKYIIEPLKNLPNVKNVNCFLTHYNFNNLNENSNLELICNKFDIYKINISDMDYINFKDEFTAINKNHEIPFYQFKWYFELYKSINAIKYYSNENNLHYDIIIIISLKCLFLEPINLNFELKENTIYVTTDENNNNNYNDIVIGNMESVKKFCNSYINFLTILELATYNEKYLRFLKNYFDYDNIKYENLQTNNFKLNYNYHKPKYTKKVTNISDRDEGFGENFSYILKTILYCEYYGYEFYYTPLKFIQHNYNNDPFFLEKKEELMNIKNHYKLSLENEKYNIPNQYELINFFDSNIDFCLKSKELEKLKNIFRENKINRFDQNFTNIAIHIRKMNHHDIKNIKHAKQYEGTDVPMYLYINYINSIKTVFNKYNKCLFHIYSQGYINDFKEFLNQDDIILHLNDTIENTYTDFVFSDILLIASSAFSYTAGMLNNGLVYSFISNRKKLPQWGPIIPYKSTKDRYFFLIKKTETFILKIYYDEYLNVFYHENKDLSKTYFDLRDIL